MPIGIKLPELIDYSKCEYCGKRKVEQVNLYLCRDAEGNYYCYCGDCLEQVQN